MAERLLALVVGCVAVRFPLFLPFCSSRLPFYRLFVNLSLSSLVRIPLLPLLHHFVFAVSLYLLFRPSSLALPLPSFLLPVCQPANQTPNDWGKKGLRGSECRRKEDEKRRRKEKEHLRTNHPVTQPLFNQPSSQTPTNKMKKGRCGRADERKRESKS